ncbi:MAG: hypothetical protein RML95_03040 [Anaerolineae bacterium]|nr:hypothetical protein [Anaerolineae bacterium]MDW8298292.1 hypothetical protein [Anaerolineae bacterium]
MTGSLRVQHKAQLKEAYALIKADRRAEAYELIAPILVQQPDYVDAWWLAAHAAPTLSLAIAACQKVLSLKPDHAPAQLMLEELRRRLAIEQHLSAEEKPRRFAPARPRPNRLLYRFLIATALIALLFAVLSGVVVFTGNTFGLPVAHFFNLEQTLPPLPPFSSIETLNGKPKLTRTATLPIGAKHRYRFDVPRPNTVLWLELTFRLSDSVPLRETVRLLLPSGFVALPRDTAELPNTLTFFLPLQGTYTLEIVGTPNAKSFYTLSLALIDPSSGN